MRAKAFTHMLRGTQHDTLAKTLYSNNRSLQMKTTILYTLLLISTTLTASAQQDAQAKAILTPLSQKYRSYTAIKSDFTFTLYNTQQNMKATQTGTLIVEPKTNKYKI